MFSKNLVGLWLAFAGPSFLVVPGIFDIEVGNEGVITVGEAKTAVTELDVVEGMQFDRGYL